MRLRGLTLSKYGNYDAERIGFSPEKGVVNLLLAPNGAGKSVLRQAFGDLLFGIGNQTSMGFRHGYNGMRVTAEIARPDGTSVSFIRPKARGNPVLGLDGEPLAPGFLASILGSRDKPLLERLFALDTAALREGGRALLESGGDVASALLSAAGGIRQARALKQKLERRRDDLAPERRTGSRPFYQALDQFNDARRRAAAATLRPDQWEKQDQTLAALEETRRASQEAAATAFAEIARLERVRRVGPPLSQRAEVEAWLAAHPDARALDPSLTGLLTQARLDLSTSETAAKDAVARLAAAEQVLAGITVDEALLAHADQISRLVLDAGAARKARDDDLPVVRGQHEHRVSAILVRACRRIRSPPICPLVRWFPARGNASGNLTTCQAEPDRCLGRSRRGLVTWRTSINNCWRCRRSRMCGFWKPRYRRLARTGIRSGGVTMPGGPSLRPKPLSRMRWIGFPAGPMTPRPWPPCAR